jgi:N-acetylneuraminic acid mutarotase
VNDVPVFTAGPNLSIPLTVTAPQSLPAWAAGIDDADPEVVQSLTFNVNVTTGAAIFSSLPTLDTSGKLDFTLTGVGGSATVEVSLTDDNTASGAALTSPVQTFTITQEASDVSSLSAFSLSTGTLSPAFSAAELNYTADVSNLDSTITVTPTGNAFATLSVSVNGGAFAPVTSGSPSPALPLVVGPNTIQVKVLAQDGVTETIYTLVADRAESPNANLASLATSNGTLAPVFSPAQLGYTVNVPSTVTSLRVIPTVQEPNATIKVNTIAVASGVASGAIPLNTGATVITVDVLAHNGVSTQGYTITVNRSSVVVSDQADSGVKNNLLVKALDITGTPDGPLVFSILTPPTDGTLIKANDSDTVEIADGNYRYRPDLGFKGLDSFTYQVSDNSGILGTATVTINIVERPPFWSHEGGSNLAKQKGFYPAVNGTGTPGARSGAASWSDGQGNIYVFGGLGFGSLKGPGNLNDLWRLNTVTKAWTFLGGGTDINGAPVYGTKGTAAPANIPGARAVATTWTDAAGTLWLFGGLGRDSTPTGVGPLNDLWKYSGGAWTWVSGDNLAKQNGVYSGTAKPGGRSFAAGWADQLGNLYLFGGNGMANSGTAIALMNDVWKYDVGLNTWTHLKGLPIAKGLATYGVKGVPNNANTPGARSGSSAWVGPDGMFYLFGGSANNDLWKYNPSANVWTWINGQTKAAGKGVYATLGVADSRNEPAARSGASSWVAPDGSLMLFGGLGPLDDVWSYNLSTNLWTWVKGAPLAGAKPVYGTLTVGAEPNTPGARHQGVVGTDAKGDVWAFSGVNGANSFNDLFKLDVAAETLATTLAASNATTTSATLEGVVNPNGFETSAFFRYGKLLDLSDAVETTAMVLGDGTTALSITETVSGLEAGTIYYFQAVAQNDFSTSYGEVRAVTTTGIGASTVQFATAGSTVSESIGTNPVTVTLSKPSATTVTVVVTSSVAPTSTTLTFAPGQTTAILSVSISSNTSVGAPTPINLAFGTISGGTTAVAVATHVITVQDDDQALAIVTTPQSQFVAVKDSLVLNVAVTGSAPIIYQWKKNGVVIKGATAATYTVHNATAAVAGSYTVDVINPVGAAPAVPAAAVYVVDATPKSFVTTIGKPVTMSVSASGPGPVTYLWKKGASPAPGVNNAKTYLPPVTTAETAVYVCQVTGGGTVVGQGGENTLRIATVTAVTYPAGMLGSYLSIVDRNTAVGNNLGARVDLTITATGTFSAKLTGDGVASTLTGALIPTLSGATVTSASGRADFIRKGLPTLRLTFTVDAADGLVGQLVEEDTNTVQAFTGYRNKWLAAKSLPTAYYLDGAPVPKPSPYTFALEIPSALAGALDIPQGNGFGSFTPTADGKATVVGFTADGFAYTSAGFVGPGFQVGIYSLFKARVGSIAGTGTIALSGAAGVNNTFQGTFTWSKQAALPIAKDQLYRAGFAPMALTIIGGKYKAPALGGVVAGLTNADNKARIVFAEGGLATGQIDGGLADAKTNSVVFTIKNTKPTAVTQTVILPLTPANPNKLTFKLAAKPLGQFSGTVNVNNTLVTLNRTATFQGMIVWTGSTYIAPGYFILSQLPEPGQTVTSSTQLSGVLDLEPNP